MPEMPLLGDVPEWRSANLPSRIVTGEIELDGLPEEGGEQENVWQALMEALTHLLSVDISRIALPNQNRRVQRRGQKNVFEIVGEASQAGALSEVLKSRNLASQLSSQLSRDYSMNITAQVLGGDFAESLVKRPVGEIWEEVCTHALAPHSLAYTAFDSYCSHPCHAVPSTLPVPHG